MQSTVFSKCLWHAVQLIWFANKWTDAYALRCSADESHAENTRNFILLRLGLNSSWYV